MPAFHSTFTHPSHHPPNAIPAPTDAAQSITQHSEEGAPFTEVIGRGKKARNAQSKRVSPQQTTLPFSGTSPAAPAFSSSVVSVNIADRVEQTTEGVAASARDERRTTDRATTPAASAGTSETVRLDQLTSSSRATQHSSPSPSHALTRPTGSNGGTEQEDNRMRDIAAAAKRARELDSVLPPQATAMAATSSGHIHPERQLLMRDGALTHSAADNSGKEEADPSSGQDKRRRTAPPRSAASSPDSPLSAITARRDAPPTVEEYNRVMAELHASRKESGDLRARLEQLERQVAALQTPSPTPMAASPLVAGAAPPTRNNNTRTTVPSVAASSTAAVASTSTVSGTVSGSPVPPRSQPARHHALAEPKATLLASLSLSPYSTTDLMLNVSLPPVTVKMARGHFPNHATQPANHRMGIVNLLQGANGLQLLPPRVPLFMAKAHGERDCVATLQQSYPPDSREYRYLDCLLQADRNGDEYDLCQHSFSDAECVSTWHQLLALETRVVSSQHQRKLYIRLALLNPVLTVAVTAAVAAHMQHVQQSLKASQSRHQIGAARSGTTSPTPSVASTASSTSTEEQVHSSTSDMEDIVSNQPPSPLRQGAMHSTISVAPFRLRYAMCTISNWPRAHPTELCASNHHLAAFVRQHAPDVRLVTKEENGMTSGSVTAYCQQRHLSQLTGLNGRVSDEHGIHFPLRLHTTIHVMGAKTCTFCWQPNHGAAQCPRRAGSAAAAHSVPAQPACRHCYSFSHTSEACTTTAVIRCTLCKQEGHCTSQCAHFFPSRLPLQHFLAPTNSNQQRQQQRRTTSVGKSGTPAPILSDAHSATARPWQTSAVALAERVPAPASHTPNPPTVSHSQQASQASSFVTLEQLTAALAPITQALQQIQRSHQLAEQPSAVHSCPPTAAAQPHKLP